MDQRAFALLTLAVQLIASGAPGYREAEVGDVVDSLIDAMGAATAVLDHPSTCTGCATCTNQAPDRKGTTLQ